MSIISALISMEAQSLFNRKKGDCSTEMCPTKVWVSETEFYLLTQEITRKVEALLADKFLESHP